VDIAKNKFMELNQNFFKSVFFDFAPLMSVPAYLEEPCASLDEIDDYYSNYTYYEHEVMANAVGDNKFAHESSATPAILKTDLMNRQGTTDNVMVTANSFYTIDRLDFVPVFGGDGRMHPVPVHWLEYIPVSKSSSMLVNEYDIDAKDNITSDGTYYHGLVARKLNDN
jgi:hypothetical protein